MALHQAGQRAQQATHYQWAILAPYVCLGHECQDFGGPWNACVHRLDLGLHSHPQELWGVESNLVLTQRKICPQRDRSDKGWTCDTVSYRIASTTHNQLSHSGPLTTQNAVSLLATSHPNCNLYPLSVHTKSDTPCYSLHCLFEHNVICTISLNSALHYRAQSPAQNQLHSEMVEVASFFVVKLVLPKCFFSLLLFQDPARCFGSLSICWPGGPENMKKE